MAVLDPDVVLRADFGLAGGSREIRGAAAVAGRALGYAQIGLDLRPALINGVAGAITFLHGEPFSIAAVTVRNGKIVELDFLADPERLRLLDLAILDSEEATIATEASATNASSAAIPTARALM